MSTSSKQKLKSILFTSGKGAYCWDKEGKKYIDFICGYGPIILGHSYEVVNQAVREQLEKGSLFPNSGELIELFSQKLFEIFDDYQFCHFVKTGSEAVTASIRLARAASNRKKIIKCGYLGWHDEIISPDISWHTYEPISNLIKSVPGITEHENSIIWSGENLEDLFQIIDSHNNDIAALILDPVQMRHPIHNNIKLICAVLESNNILLILDETKTSFRINLKGFQGLYNIKPDITILGKAIANGLPLAVVLAKKNFKDFAKLIKLKGTYNTDLISIAAANATISIIVEEDILPKINKKGEYFINLLNKVLQKYNLSEDIVVVPYRWNSMPFIWFKTQSFKAQIIKKDFYNLLAESGVLLLPNHMNFINYSHKKEDIDELCLAVEKTLCQLA